MWFSMFSTVKKRTQTDRFRQEQKKNKIFRAEKKIDATKNK